MFRVSSSAAVVASGALCLGLLAGLPAAVAQEPAVEPVESSGLEEALAQARADGEPVEDEEQRTESTSVFANPDGTLTHRDFGGPVRLERGGEWVDVDYTLIERPDGSYAPKAAPVDVSVNAGPADEAARVTFDDGQAMAVTWPTGLPEPTVEGGVATYELSAATDLIIAVTSEGLNAHLRLNEQPAAGDPVFTFGLRTKGVDLEQSADGGLDVLDADGEVLGGTRTLVAWDAETDAAGEPVNIVPLEADLTEDATRGTVTDNTLELTTPEGFLSDPSTQYPVTIDPDIKVTASPRDIWVRSGVTEGQGSDASLRVGKMPSHSNQNPARSYVWFSTPSTIGSRTDVQVVSASLNLWQYHGATCSNRRMSVHPTKDAWNGNITWPNRPTSHLQDAYHSPIYVNRAASGCARDWSKVNVTKIAKAWWQDRALNNHGFTLLAGSEGDHEYERRFCSKENDSSHSYCNTATRRPFLDVTYTVAPNKPAVPTVSVTGSSATIRAKVSDPSNQNVRARFIVKTGSTVVFDGFSPYVASGGQAMVAVSDLVEGAVYQVQAWASNVDRSSVQASSMSFVLEDGETEIPVAGATFEDGSEAVFDTSTGETTITAPEGVPAHMSMASRMSNSGEFAMAEPSVPAEADAPIGVDDLADSEDGEIPDGAEVEEFLPNAEGDPGEEFGWLEHLNLHEEQEGNFSIFAEVPLGYTLSGNNRVDHYRYYSYEWEAWVGKKRKDGSIKKQGRAMLTYRQILNGGSSRMWNLQTSVRHVSGFAFDYYYEAWCGVVRKRKRDITCRTDDDSASRSGIEHLVEDVVQDQRTVRANEWYDIGKRRPSAKKYPLIRYRLVFHDPKDGKRTVYMKARGWDTVRKGGTKLTGATHGDQRQPAVSPG